MHPSSLLSYYPTYSILDEIVSYNQAKKMNIFIDLKNTLQTVYMEHAIVNIIESTKRSQYIDTSVFSSLISFLSFHKMYGMKRGITTNFFIFFETGQSYYHQNISKEYKISRRIDNLYGLEREDRDLFVEVMHSNLHLIDHVCNKLPTVVVIRLPNLEADFVPYYLISRNLITVDSQTTNVVYSNDHDLHQCIPLNCYIFSKSAKKKEIIGPGSVMSHFLGKKVNIDDNYLPLAMAVIGDVGDDVRGVNGIGPSRFAEIFDELIALSGPIDEIYRKVQNDEPLFDIDLDKIPNKQLRRVVEEEVKNQLISKNLKLVSFELLSRALDNPTNTSLIDKREIILSILREKKIYSADSIKEALERLGVVLEEASLDFMYI